MFTAKTQEIDHFFTTPIISVYNTLMSKALSLIQLCVWILYIFTITYLLIDATYYFFSPKSPVAFYYFFLKAFDPIYYIKWLTHLTQIIISWLHWLVLIFYVFNIPIGPRWICKIALPIRLILDIFGRNYEMNIYESLYKTDLQIFWIVLGASISIYIPSYIACYLYAYGNKDQRKL